MTIGSGRLFLVARGIQGVSWIRQFSVKDSFICGPKSWNLKVKRFATFHERKSIDFTGLCGHLGHILFSTTRKALRNFDLNVPRLVKLATEKRCVGCRFSRLVAGTKATKCAVESDREQVEQLIRKLYSNMATIEILWDDSSFPSGRDESMTHLVVVSV